MIGRIGGRGKGDLDGRINILPTFFSHGVNNLFSKIYLFPLQHGSAVVVTQDDANLSILLSRYLTVYDYFPLSPSLSLSLSVCVCVSNPPPSRLLKTQTSDQGNMTSKLHSGNNLLQLSHPQETQKRILQYSLPFDILW